MVLPAQVRSSAAILYKPSEVFKWFDMWTSGNLPLFVTVSQVSWVELTASVRKRKINMAPIDVLAPFAYLMIMTLAGNEARQHSMKLMTRPSDAAALCALNRPTLSAAMSQEMPEAPEAVRCAMTCTSDGGCKHFNYVSTESNPCQLYHYRPTNFDVSPNCQHYYEPGHLIWLVICSAVIIFKYLSTIVIQVI